MLTRGGGAGCGMSAEGLAVLATQGVAKSSSLSKLNLSGETGVCCLRICIARVCVALRVGVYVCVSAWMCVYVACVSHAVFLYVYPHLYLYVHACLVCCMQNLICKTKYMKYKKNRMYPVSYLCV